MHLTPREEERLLLSAAADLARRRLARGARLGSTEAIAVVCDEICEMAWDDLPLDEVLKRARGVVAPEGLLPGVANAVRRIEVEALFPHGSVLVHLDHPFGEPDQDGPGGVRTAVDEWSLAPQRRRSVVTVHNTGALPIWISSHVPLSTINRAAHFTPADVSGLRLDLPAGAALKVDPGQQRELSVIAFREEASQ